RNNLKEIKILALDREQQTTGQKKVAHKYGDFIFPQCIYGEEAPTVVGFIHDIVVYQCRGVKEFNERGAAESRLPDPPGRSGAEKDEHGPHLLSLALDDVVHDLIEQQYTGLHRGPELQLEVLHLAGDRRLYFIERWRHLTQVYNPGRVLQRELCGQPANDVSRRNAFFGSVREDSRCPGSNFSLQF